MSTVIRPAPVAVAALGTVAFTDVIPPLQPLATLGLLAGAALYIATCHRFPLRACPAPAGAPAPDLRLGVRVLRRLRRARDHR